MKFWVLTISDSCFEGTSEDISGPTAVGFLTEKLAAKSITPYKPSPAVLPDELETIRSTVQQICDVPMLIPASGEDGAGMIPNPSKVSLLVTIGGTGFGQRDVTPEAIKPLLTKEASGIVHAILSYSLGPNGTPYAWLSRPVAGVRNGTLVITVPGSKKAVIECLTPLVDYGLAHALELINGDVSKKHPTTHAAVAAGDGSGAASAIPSSCTCCTSAPLPPPPAVAAPPLSYAFDPSRGNVSSVGMSTAAEGLVASPSAAPSATTTGAAPTTAASVAVAPLTGRGRATALAHRPRNSDYPMVPMIDALAVIEAKCRESSRCGVTVVGSAPPATATSTSAHTADNSPRRFLTTDMASDATMGRLPSRYYSSAEEAAKAVEGTVLAAPVVSGVDLPPFRASIKDGYAVVSVDGKGVFPVASEATAGGTFSRSFLLQTGQVCRVSTGGPVPDGADAVVQVEDTELLEASADGEEELVIRVKKQVAPNTDIRPIGCDIAIGQRVLEGGAKMGPSEVALWHSVGQPPIVHYFKPSVAVLSTGNELSSETPLPEGKIYDSNKGMLLSALRGTKGGGCGGCGIVEAAVDGGIARDDYNATREAIVKAFRTGADANARSTVAMVISTGGVSMGEKDHVKAALLSLGATIHFGRVNMKPGKPTTFATIPATAIDGPVLGEGQPDRLFFGLPGNPVSAMVCYHVFVVPALRVMCGLSPRLPTLSVQLTHAVGLDRERPEYHRCRLQRCPTRGMNGLLITAASTGLQASHRLLSMHTANGLLVLPTGTDANGARIEGGSFVEAIVIDEIM